MTTRSATLGHASTTALQLNGTLCTVPAGETWIVKDIRVLNVNAGPASAIISVTGVGNVDGTWLINKTLAGVSYDGMSCWVVMEPGDYLVYASDQGLVRFWVSGAKLVGIAT